MTGASSAAGRPIVAIWRVQKSHLRFKRLAKREALYVVASDDIRVHRLARALPFVADVTWLSGTASFHSVAEDVVSIVERVNGWLRSLDCEPSGIPTELLYWIKHCEGGITTQRVQDALLFIDSCHRILGQFNPSELIVLAGAGTAFEDRLASAVATSHGIRVRIVGRWRWWLGSARNVGRLLLREMHAGWCWIHSRLGPPEPRGINTGLIIIQLCSSALKHLAHTLPLMSALQKAESTPVALCWGAPTGARRVRRAGLRADELERWMPPTAWPSSWWRSVKTFVAARRHRATLEARVDLEYRSVPLGPVLWPSIRQFLLAEAGPRYRLHRASVRYFATHVPIAIRYWTRIFPEAVIVHNGIKRWHSPLVFHQPGFPYAMPSPYDHAQIPCDLVLVLGPDQKRFVERQADRPTHVEVIGQPGWEHFHEFQNRYSAKESRELLGLSATSSFSVLLDTNAVLPGYLSAQEQIQTADVLLAFAKKHPTASLILKPHPGHRKGVLETLVSAYGCPNVYLVGKRDPTYHCINAVDLVVTKFSNIGVEALCLNKPVIAALLDGDDRFMAFGNAAAYVKTAEELESLLDRLATDPAFREEWRAERLARAASYLEATVFRPNERPSDLAAAAIIRRLVGSESHQKAAS